TAGRRAGCWPARAAPREDGRKPWSTVTAMSFGPRLSAPRQRAISISSAVESGPPETARTRARTRASGASNAFASAAETGAASSAADTLLFSLDPLPHRGRRARKFAQDFSERRAGRLLLAERGKRLSEAQKRIGRLGGGFVFGRDVEEGFRRVAEALALEHAFAEPIGGVAREPIVGIFAQEAVEGVFSERVVFAQHIAISEIVFVARGLRGRERGERAAGSGVLRRLPRLRAAWRPHGCEIERRGRAAPAGGAEGVGRARRIRILGGIERIPAPAGRCGRRRRRRQVLRARLRRSPRHALFLHAADLALELLIAKLQLLDRPGHLPNLGFEALEPQHEIGALRRALCARGRRAAAHALTSVENAEQTERPFGLLCPSPAQNGVRRRHRHEDERGCRRHTKREACHGDLAVLEPWNTIRIPASKL